MLHSRLDEKTGWKKLEGDGFYIHYPSADEPNPIPTSKGGIEDDVAERVAEQFVGRCDNSSANISREIADMQREGGIATDTKHGRIYFHLRHLNGSKVSLEIYH